MKSRHSLRWLPAEPDQKLANERIGPSWRFSMPDIANIIYAATAGIIGSAAGAGIPFGFFAKKSIDSWFDKVSHKEKLLSEKDLEFRQRQIEELYGPIYASLRLSSTIYPLWLSGKLQEINRDIIELFDRQNKEIVTILKTKAHLLDGAEYPPEFTQFMTSSTIWGMYCTRRDEPWLPEHIKEISEIKWPTEFEKHFYQKTKELKTKLADLLNKHRI